MKKTMKCMTSLLLVLVLAMSLSMTTFAAGEPPVVTFNGHNTQTPITFTPGSRYTASDLFAGFKNVMPGDVIEQEITIRNNDSSSDYIKVYLKAIPHDGEGNPLTYNEAYENEDGKDQKNEEDQRDENAVTMDQFLKQLKVTIKNGEDVIYTDPENSADRTAGPTEFVLLIDNLSRGSSANLTVELKVPIELGNEYANRVGEVDWKIKVESYTTATPPAPGPGPGPGPGPDPGPDPDPDEDEFIIPDDDVPLGDLPDEELEDILDEEPPLAILPQTGLLQWPIPVMCAAGLLLIALGLLSEQKRKAQSN